MSFYCACFSTVIYPLHIFPHGLKNLKRQISRMDHISSIIEESYELLRLGPIRDHDMRNTMDTCQDSRVESHPNDRMKSRINFERRLDCPCSIVCLPCHDTLDIEYIILTLISTTTMDKKYWIISVCLKIFIDSRYLTLTFSEKSTPDRNPYSFLLWKFLDLLWYKEKCDIRNL